MSLHIADPNHVQDDTNHRHCHGCGTRLPRWKNGKQRRTDAKFCSASCRVYSARKKRPGTPLASVTDQAFLTPILRASKTPIAETDPRRQWPLDLVGHGSRRPANSLPVDRELLRAVLDTEIGTAPRQRRRNGNWEPA
jgi:hypothetical protein